VGITESLDGRERCEVVEVVVRIGQEGNFKGTEGEILSLLR
jgi:hypothetical protein